MTLCFISCFAADKFLIKSNIRFRFIFRTKLGSGTKYSHFRKQEQLVSITTPKEKFWGR